MSAPNRSPVLAQSGQVLPIFAIVVVLLFAVTALVIDMGFLFGERRLDQSAADAGALAAAEKMARSAVARNDGDKIAFFVADADVYQTAVYYSTQNQTQPKVDEGRIVVTMEYSTGFKAGSPTEREWCYSPASPAPNRTPAVSECPNLPAILPGGEETPPYPGSVPFLVRVTVSSTIEPVFSPAGQVGRAVPGPASSDDAAACVNAGGTGRSNTTCAQAIAAVVGTATPANGGPLLPVSTGYCDLATGGLGVIHNLMEPHKDLDCGYDNLKEWRNYLDLSSAAVWGSGGYKNDYKSWFPALGPGPSGTDYHWNRADYQADKHNWTETGVPGDDFIAWIAKGFGGVLPVGPVTGVKVPLYGQDKSLGGRINDGFYCNTGGGTQTTCTKNPANSYFFALNQPGLYFVCPDDYGKEYNLGCRDASIATWNLLEAPNKKNTDWETDASIKPERARLASIVTMRLYCAHGTGNEDDYCNNQPTALSNCPNGTSGVCGVYAAPYGTVPCDTCAPTLNGVMAKLWK